MRVERYETSFNNVNIHRFFIRKIRINSCTSFLIKSPILVNSSSVTRIPIQEPIIFI